MHHLTAAHKIASLTLMYNREICINFITGTSISDLESINSFLEHSKRYDRLVEYIEIINRLLRSKSPQTYHVKYFQTKNLNLSKALNEKMMPDFFIAGASTDAQNARFQTNARGIDMGKPIRNLPYYESIPPILHFGVATGPTGEAAQDKMKLDFSSKYDDIEDIFEIALANTDAAWKRRLILETEDNIYSLIPLKNMTADCPYLVGSCNTVADYINGYVQKGINTFIIEADESDLMA